VIDRSTCAEDDEGCDAPNSGAVGAVGMRSQDKSHGELGTDRLLQCLTHQQGPNRQWYVLNLSERRVLAGSPSGVICCHCERGVGHGG